MKTKEKIQKEIRVDPKWVELQQRLIAACGEKERLELLEAFVGQRLSGDQSPLEKVVVLSLRVIGQEVPCSPALCAVETFYREIGGIVGYHVTCLSLLKQKGEVKKRGIYHPPVPFDLTQKNRDLRRRIRQGLLHLDQLAAFFPIGGGADRLSHLDEETGEFQPAAKFVFCGRSLLMRLMDDLQALEYLHYKCFGKQVRIPTLLMTSDEKQNTTRVKEAFSQANWLGRKEEDFFLLSQPLVPTMDATGRWIEAPKGLLLKPGGHGIIWKLARENGVFSQLKGRGIRKIFLRQINNPVAGVDDGILAFLGIGFARDQSFGFAACPKTPGVAEGVDVVIETPEGCKLTNIEYCDFAHCVVEEKVPLLANTNLLFADRSKAEELIGLNPIPGMLVNAKPVSIEGGEKREVLRLESTMQNLADALVEPCGPLEMQETYITTNHRRKTISSIKQEHTFGRSMLQTPEQCLYDLLENGRELLTSYLKFDVPPLPDPLDFALQGPSFLFHYHSALGPLYSIIAQKISYGKLARGSELNLQISDVEISNLHVDGALCVFTDAPMGHLDEEQKLLYSNETGKCTLINVKVCNRGIHREAVESYWKGSLVYKERCEIFIEEGGEFHAENVSFFGNLRIRVPSGVRITAVQQGNQIQLKQEVLSKPSWTWELSFDEEDEIRLHKKKSS